MVTELLVDGPPAYAHSPIFTSWVAVKERKFPRSMITLNPTYTHNMVTLNSMTHLTSLKARQLPASEVLRGQPLAQRRCSPTQFRKAEVYIGVSQGGRT